jgi:5'-nucleotidase
MNILVVNDDGYQAKGLKVLVSALSTIAQVYVSAPKNHQSAKSHAITIKNKIETFFDTPIPGSEQTLVVDGTPADAVRLALKLYPIDFDLCVSGINYGQNIAMDILYSGTVAAATEAKILGLNAVAISAPTPHLLYLHESTIELFEYLIKHKLYEQNGILNINFPNDQYTQPKGIKFTQMGIRFQHAEFQKSEKPNIFYIQSSKLTLPEKPKSDVLAVKEGYISITPLKIDRTDDYLLEALSKQK